MSLIFRDLVPQLSLIFITKAVPWIVNVAPVEVVIASQEASMVMVTSIGQAVESVCCSPCFILADSQYCKVELDDFRGVFHNCLGLTNLGT